MRKKVKLSSLARGSRFFEDGQEYLVASAIRGQGADKTVNILTGDSDWLGMDRTVEIEAPEPQAVPIGGLKPGTRFVGSLHSLEKREAIKTVVRANGWGGIEHIYCTTSDSQLLRYPLETPVYVVPDNN